MALELNYTEKGLNVPRCYVKVASVNASKERAIAVATYQAIEGDGSERKFFDVFASESFQFIPSITNENFIAQAYKKLKTLPNFSGALDC